jgi:hypothetical protein
MKLNLSKQIDKWIKETGVEEVAAMINRKVPTVKSWMTSGAYPVMVVEKYLESKGQDKSESLAPPTPDMVLGGPQPDPVQTNDRTPDEYYQAFLRVEEMLSLHSAKINNIEQFLVNAQINSRANQVRPIAPPPRVVNPEASTAADVSPHFTPLQQLGGNKPHEQPETLPDGFGMSMKALLQPRPLRRRD